MQIYLAVTPAEAREAARFRRPLAHVAYRIGPESTLLRQNLLLETRGGLLSVTDRDAPLHRRPERLAAAAVRECGRRRLQRRAAGLRSLSAPDRLAFAEALARRLAPRPLYVPESCGVRQGAVSLVCTAVSGGSFTQYLREAAAGRRRAGWPWTWSGCGWTSPSPPGAARAAPQRPESSGTCWTGSPRRCSSPRTCAPGTSPTPGRARPTSSSSTMRTPSSRSCGPGSSLGFSAAFLMYPEVRDLLPRLFPSRRT